MSVINLELKLSNGDMSSLVELYPGQRILLYFYPKDMTSGCTTQAQGLRDNHKFFTENGIRVVGVSCDSIARHEKFIQLHDLPFILVSDQSQALCEGFGVWKEKSMYGKKYMGIERSTFLLDNDRSIMHEWRRVKPATHVQDLVEYVSS